MLITLAYNLYCSHESSTSTIECARYPNIFIEEHRICSPLDFEADVTIILNFNTTVSDWRCARDLIHFIHIPTTIIFLTIIAASVVIGMVVGVPM